MTDTILKQLGTYLGERFKTHAVNPETLGTEEDLIAAMGGGAAGDSILSAVGEAINELDDNIRADLSTKATKTTDMPILDVSFLNDVPAGWTYNRQSTATYFDPNGNIQTATADTPRFERDPLTGRKLGMLIEKQRTNMFLWSSQFDNAAWLKNESTVTQPGTDGTSPLGTSWWRLNETTANEEHSVTQYLPLAPGKHTISVMVKDGGTMGQFTIGANGDGGAWYGRATFDTTTHSRVSTFFNNAMVALQRTDIRRVKTDVWIYSLTIHVNNVSNVNAYVGIFGTSTTSNAFYTGTDRHLLFAYLQVEKGACRTSYIPTTAAAATRARDVLYKNVSEVTDFSQLCGTMAAEVTPLTGSAENACFVNINGGTEDAYIDLLMTSDRYQFQFFDGNANLAVGSTDYSWRAGVVTTLVGAWKDQQFAFSEGGLIEYNHLGGLVPKAMQRINVGNRNIAGEADGDSMDGHFCIRRLRIWSDRLSDQDVVKLSMLQEDRVRSDRTYRQGVGAASTTTNPNIVLDVNPGADQGRGTDVANISSTVYVNRPLSANMYPVGVRVTMAPVSDWRPVEATTKFVSVIGVSSIMSRNNALDSATSSSSGIYGGLFTASHGVLLNDDAVTGTMWGVNGAASGASGTINTAYGVRGNISATGTSAGAKSAYIGAAYSLYANVQVSSGGSGETAWAGSVGNAYGLYVNASTTTTGTNGTIANLYGVYIGTQPSMRVGGTGGGIVTDKYAIYQAGVNDKSYFGGSVSTGMLSPIADDTSSLGDASHRWSQVFSATGTINTSDARSKTVVSPLSVAEVEASKAIAREIGTYRFLDAVQAKGDDARRHIGLTVQRAITIMEEHGLDPMAYGFICHDTWDAKTINHPEEVEEVEGEGDDAERTIVVIRESWSEHIPAGDRYGFRTDELLLFLARGFDARLTALEE